MPGLGGMAQQLLSGYACAALSQRPSRLAHRLEIVLHGIFTDFASHRCTDFTRSAVMHTIVYARIDCFADVVREPAEFTGDPWCRGARQSKGRHCIAEKGFEYSGSGSAIDVMHARIFGC